MKRIAVTCTHPTPDTPPLGLGMCLASARQQLPSAHFDLEARFARSEAELEDMLDPRVVNVLLCSNNVMSLDLNLTLSRRAREIDPRIVTVHGGPSTPAHPGACERFLAAHPEIDLAVRGEGEEVLVEILDACQADAIATAEIAGVSRLQEGRFIRHPDRLPIADLRVLPSPYLTGIFSTLDAGQWRYAAVETNRGCPYRCAFCSWQTFSPGEIRTFPVERVQKELEWVADQGILALFIADSNFGILERDLDIARLIARVREGRCAPRLIMVEYAKRPVERLEQIVEVFAHSELVHGGAIAIQTRDPHTLEVVGRQNLSTADYDQLERVFLRLGLDFHTFLMLGLPGTTVSSFKSDLRFYFERPATVLIFRTLLLPNSPMAHPDFMAEHGIQADERGFVARTRTMTAAEMDWMKRLACLFDAVHNNGILRYPIRWLQWDRGLDPIDLLAELAGDPLAGERLPELLPVFEGVNEAMIGRNETLARLPRDPESWMALNRGFASWLRDRAIDIDDPAFETILEVQTAIMPVTGRHAPVAYPLDFDVVAWYRDHVLGSGHALGTYEPGRIEVSQPASHGYSFELQSALSDLSSLQAGQGMALRVPK